MSVIHMSQTEAATDFNLASKFYNLVVMSIVFHESTLVGDDKKTFHGIMIT